MLSLALPTYPHTLLNFVRALSGKVGAQVSSSILCISYTPLGSRVGRLGAFFRVWDLIVVIDGGVCSSGSVDCVVFVGSGGGVVEWSDSDSDMSSSLPWRLLPELDIYGTKYKRNSVNLTA